MTPIPQVAQIVIAAAIGMLAGIAAQRPGICRKDCCLSSRRRERWMAGLPPDDAGASRP